MNILIVDDEVPARERLRLLIDDLNQSQWRVMASLENGQQALDFCRQHQVDVIFMDIRMPVMDGLEAAQNLTKNDLPPVIIFTTAYSEYALDAFDAQGVAYLLKPIKKQRLKEVLDRVTKPNRLQQTMQSQVLKPEQYISGSFRGGIKRIAVKDVLYFYASQKYVTAVTEEDEVLLDESLISLEKRQQEGFVRIHRNALVARGRIMALEKKEGKMFMVLRGTDLKLEISRRHLPEIRKLLKSTV